uniref:Peptidase_M13_N domain-containing protein n=1 Tax=Angiostrongylus cantonensis TaxID=6313 RepID=A0A0K0DLZ4_ANGCA
LVHFCVAKPDFVRPCDDEPEHSDPPGYNVASDMLTKSINHSFSQGFVQLVPHRDYYLNIEEYGRMTELYKQYLIQMVELLYKDAGGSSSSQRQIEYEIEEIMDFESKLAKIMVDDEDQMSHTEMYNLRRLSEMQALMPLVGISFITCVQFMKTLHFEKGIAKVNWTNFFYSITPPTVHGYIAADPEIMIEEIDYMKRLTKLLNSTDSVIIANYVYVSYTLRWRSELGIKYHRAAHPPSRTKCFTNWMERMREACHNAMPKRFWCTETRNATLEMVNYVKEAFQDMLVENDWLDSSTKASALDKARNIRRVIGYPDFILDDKKLDDFYSGLDITESDSYTEMMEKWIHWRISHEFKRLVTPADAVEVLGTNLNVNSTLPQRGMIAEHGGVKVAFKNRIQRVNQVLANQPEFAAAFNCPVGTPMNPTSRCAIW